MTLIVTIDRDECIQCGRCYEDECPEVFEEGDDGTSQIVEKYRGGNLAEGNVPDDLKDCITAAAEACPVDVISINQK